MENETESPLESVPAQIAEVVAEIDPHVAEVMNFLNEYGLNRVMSKKKLRDLVALSPDSFEAFKLNSIIAACCKVMDLDRAFATYLEAKTRNIHPSHVAFITLLNLTAGLGEQGSCLGPPRETEPPSNFEAAFEVFQDMKIRNVRLTEPIFTATIRCCSMHNRTDMALQLYHEMKALEIAPKLRTFSSLLAALASVGDIKTCTYIFEEINTVHRIAPTEREFLCMFRACTPTRDPSFYSYLHYYMEEVMLPTRAAWPVLASWFKHDPTDFTVTYSGVSDEGVVACNGEQLLSIDLDECTIQSLLKQVVSLATEEDARVSERSALPPDSTATVPSVTTATTAAATAVSGIQEEGAVVPVESEPAATGADVPVQAPVVVAAVAEKPAVVVQTKKNKRRTLDVTARKEKFEAFQVWLRKHAFRHEDGSPMDEGDDSVVREDGSVDLSKRWFDVIVDGANVGYYQQNFSGAPSHVDYVQIDWMVRGLVSKGFRPLLVLHCRHLYADVIPAEHAAIVQRWRDEGFVYSTPGGCNDDWYWLYAAVWLRCYSVSNDELRDHNFIMLSPRWFAQWRERHQIHFSFGAWEKYPSTDLATATPSGDSTSVPPSSSEPRTWRKPVLEIPLCYSFRTQRIQHCLGSDKESSPSSYYFPAEDSDYWLCAVSTYGLPVKEVIEEVPVDDEGEEGEEDSGEAMLQEKAPENNQCVASAEHKVVSDKAEVEVEVVAEVEAEVEVEGVGNDSPKMKKARA